MKKFTMVKNHIDANIAPSYERILKGEKPYLVRPKNWSSDFD